MNHTYGDWTVTTEPGCESVGVETCCCTKCGSSKTREIPATGRNYQSVVTKPTETAKGYTTYTCSNCGHSYVDSYTDKLPVKDPSNSHRATASVPPYG